jgi:hypothetical protein
LWDTIKDLFLFSIFKIKNISKQPKIQNKPKKVK